MKILSIGEVPDIHQRSFASALEVPNPDFIVDPEVIDKITDSTVTGYDSSLAYDIVRMGIVILNNEAEATNNVDHLVRRKRGNAVPIGYRADIPSLWEYTPVNEEPARMKGYISDIATDGRSKRLLTDFYRLTFADMVKIEHFDWNMRNQVEVEEGMDMTRVARSSLDTYRRPLVAS